MASERDDSDLFPLTLATWVERTDDVVEAIFREGGVLSRHVPGYRPEPAQRTYALALAELSIRGTQADDAGRVAMVEAGTGVGKTLAYLVVGLVSALLTGKRAMVSTYTRQLLFQIVDVDALIAVRVVSDMLGCPQGGPYDGRAIRVAPRRSRRAFVSPSRAMAYAEELRAANADASVTAALETYAALAEAAIVLIEDGEGAAVIASLDGLTETFDEENPHLAELVGQLPPDRFNLTDRCPGREQALWRTYGDHANAAVMTVVTHAHFIIDMSLYGRLSKARENGFALVVVDEAHDLEKAARLAFGVKVSVAEIARDAHRLRATLAEDASLSPASRAGLGKLVDAYGVAAELLANHLRDAMSRKHGVETVDILGDEPWLEAVLGLQKAMTALMVMLKAANTPACIAAEERIDRYDDEIANVLDVVGYRRDKGTPGLFRPVVSLTPVRQDPCLQVIPRHGQRVVSRIWGRGKDGSRLPMADAIAFTSATLAQPGREGWDAYAATSWTLGVGKDKLEVEKDLCLRIEPADFGRPSFVWADPRGPHMSRDGDITENGLAYAALAIEEASRRPNALRGGSCRQLVLVRSFADAGRIFEALSPEVAAKAILRDDTMPLAKAAETWRRTFNGILITPGAYEGLNLSGLIDHLHMPRLPFSPPDANGDGAADYLDLRRDMLQSLRQGFGRGIRGAKDNPTVWLMDIRLPPPEAVQNRSRVFAAPRSNPAYLAAFPARFRRAMDRGEVFVAPQSLRRARTGKDVPEKEEIS